MTACEHSFSLCIGTMSAGNQAYIPDALTTCIPPAGACKVHTSYQLAQLKYFAVFKVLLNYSSAFSPDPFQMCEPQAKWGGSTLHTYVLITHIDCVRIQYIMCIFFIVHSSFDKFSLFYRVVIILLCQTCSDIRQTSNTRTWFSTQVLKTHSWSYDTRHL